MKFELIEILQDLRPNYGDVGTRDVDVTRKLQQIDRAIQILEENTLVPRLMSAAMINAWTGGTTVTTDEIAHRTAFQDAWMRVLAASRIKTP